MEPEGSLPRSREPATCPYPEPYQSSPCPPIPLLEDPYQFFITKKINADITLRHYVIALTETEFLYVFQCKDRFLFNLIFVWG
jgi:hypothetical protein